MPKQSRTFRSSAVLSAEYDPATEELDVTFNNGRTYTYYHVPPGIWDGLAAARSAGSYIATVIRPQYGNR